MYVNYKAMEVALQEKTNGGPNGSRTRLYTVTVYYTKPIYYETK